MIIGPGIQLQNGVGLYNATYLLAPGITNLYGSGGVSGAPLSATYVNTTVTLSADQHIILFSSIASLSTFPSFSQIVTLSALSGAPSSITWTKYSTLTAYQSGNTNLTQDIWYAYNNTGSTQTFISSAFYTSTFGSANLLYCTVSGAVIPNPFQSRLFSQIVSINQFWDNINFSTDRPFILPVVFGNNIYYNSLNAVPGFSFKYYNGYNQGANVGGYNNVCLYYGTSATNTQIPYMNFSTNPYYFSYSITTMVGLVGRQLY